MTAETDCLFCRMAAGAIPVDKIFEDETVFALNDIAPRAPVHMLVIPKQHIESVRSLDEARDAALVAHMLGVANRLAADKGIHANGFRLAFNVGDDGGQTVYHLHLHVLGGHKLGPEG
jgi:histidine triad (HIT) family protein